MIRESGVLCTFSLGYACFQKVTGMNSAQIRITTLHTVDVYTTKDVHSSLHKSMFVQDLQCFVAHIQSAVFLQTVHTYIHLCFNFFKKHSRVCASNKLAFSATITDPHPTYTQYTYSHRAVLDALEFFQRTRSDPHRFSYVLDHLRLAPPSAHLAYKVGIQQLYTPSHFPSRTAYTPSLYPPFILLSPPLLLLFPPCRRSPYTATHLPRKQASLVSLINCIINTPEELRERVALREEFQSLGIEKIFLVVFPEFRVFTYVDSILPCFQCFRIFLRTFTSHYLL